MIWLPETKPTIVAAGFLTARPPPTMRKFPESLAPSCWNVPLRVPPPRVGFSKDQSPAHFPVTLTLGGALGVVAQADVTIINPTNNRVNAVRMACPLSVSCLSSTSLSASRSCPSPRLKGSQSLTSPCRRIAGAESVPLKDRRNRRSPDGGQPCDMALVLLEASGSGPMPSDDVAARYLAFSLHFDF